MQISVFKKAVLLWAAMAAVVLFYGCKKRQFIEPTRGMDAAERFWIRVLLFENIRDCSIGGDVSGGGGFSLVDIATGARCDFGASSGPVKVMAIEGGIMVGEHYLGPEVTVHAASPFVLSVDGRRYRGRLKLISDGNGLGFDVVNALPVEAYLAGVVGCEMPSYWESAALEAQTIAARTYCLFIKDYRGGRGNWDIRSTQADQVYRGILAETATVRQAVLQTSGLVMVWQRAGGQEEVFPAYYSSTCGGHTESSEHVFGRSYGPLVSRPCVYCMKVAKASFFAWPAVEYDLGYARERLVKRYPKLELLGAIKTIEPSKTVDYGGFSRITSVKIVGESGKSDYIRGEDLRLTLDPSGKKIKSTACKMTQVDGKFIFGPGRGYGHGVGMCQCGAEAMAREGRTAGEILDFYYPGAKITRYN